MSNHLFRLRRVSQSKSSGHIQIRRKCIRRTAHFDQRGWNFQRQKRRANIQSECGNNNLLILLSSHANHLNP